MAFHSVLPFVLASASPRRVELLRQIGIEPAEILPMDVDETPAPREIPSLYAARIALAKHEAARAVRPEALILTADTVVACGRRILPKAETPKQAGECLNLLSGKRHRVYTAIAVSWPGMVRPSQRTVCSHVRFKLLSKAEIQQYVASGEWQGKAGGYAIQGLAARYIEWMDGSQSNIIGLPLFETANLLEACPK